MIICHDFLPQSRRSSHVKSDYACTIIKHSLLSPFTRHLCIDISSCTLLYSLPQWHPTPLGNKPPEHRKAVRNSTGTKQNSLIALIYLPMPMARHSFISLANYRAVSTVIPLSSHPSQGILTYRMNTQREFNLKSSALLKANDGKYTENSKKKTSSNKHCV